jgi:hypothetical protein
MNNRESTSCLSEIEWLYSDFLWSGFLHLSPHLAIKQSESKPTAFFSIVFAFAQCPQHTFKFFGQWIEWKSGRQNLSLYSTTVLYSASVLRCTYEKEFAGDRGSGFLASYRVKVQLFERDDVVKHYHNAIYQSRQLKCSFTVWLKIPVWLDVQFVIYFEGYWVQIQTLRGKMKLLGIGEPMFYPLTLKASYMISLERLLLDHTCQPQRITSLGLRILHHVSYSECFKLY